MIAEYFTGEFARRLTSDVPLLYAADGKPIVFEDHLKAEVQAALQSEIQEALTRVLDEQARPESSAPKQQFDVVDGKLTLPIKFKIRDTEVKAHLPIYKILGLGVAASLFANRGEKRPVEEHVESDAWVSPVRLTVRELIPEGQPLTNRCSVSVTLVHEWSYSKGDIEFFVEFANGPPCKVSPARITFLLGSGTTTGWTYTDFIEYQLPDNGSAGRAYLFRVKGKLESPRGVYAFEGVHERTMLWGPVSAGMGNVKLHSVRPRG